MKLHP